jgi:quercetin dioxygenase-like cupin family protein
MGAPVTDEITDLFALAGELMAAAHESPDGRASHTVVHGPRQRAVLMALTAGTGLGEHASPPAATFQVLQGRARLTAGEQAWEVPAGGLVPVPPQRHGVENDEDAVILLTVALEG